MNRLHVIWQRDLSRGRYRDGGSDLGGAPPVYPREHEGICDLLRGFSLVHHLDVYFSTAIPGSVVVLEGQNYDVRSVRRYVIDTLDIARLQEKTSRWWRRYVQDLRTHIQDSVRASLGIEPSPDSDSSSVPREGIARRPSSPAPSG